MKFTSTTEKSKFDNGMKSIYHYPTKKQLFYNGRVVDIYTLLGDFVSFTVGVAVFDAGTGSNNISLGYFKSEVEAMKRIRRHFAQQERGDTYQLTCSGKTCCDGTPVILEAYSLIGATKKCGMHWWSLQDFILLHGDSK